jgi:DNA-binding NarL/FixJ family response regulator
MEVRTVLLIVDQGLGWDEVGRTLVALPAVEVCGEATTAAEAGRLAQAHRPAFIVATDLLDDVITLPLLAKLAQGQSQYLQTPNSMGYHFSEMYICISDTAVEGYGGVYYWMGHLYGGRD